ncbi:MAG TPA: dolichyl-phosphate beta-glucosyltransferase [Pyrinomonadaceae bacterium]|nr:dolichyl-phosphate beta-glucosyltransferase [Pyrinomonadaceae bacterium]
MSQQPSLSLVIPAYNESARLGSTLAGVFDYLAEQPYAAELIVVDDGSTDDTSAVAERGFAAAGRTEARVIRVEPNRGKGYAVRTGLLAARGAVALFSDADLSTPITETPKLVAPIRAGQYDIVFGSRALDRKLIGVHQPWRREQSGRVFNLAVRLATRLPFWDTQCGFKAFRMDVCRPVVEGLRIDRFGFDVELLYVAHLAGLRLKERAVRWDDVAGSKVTLRNGIEGFLELRELRRQARRGVYDEAVARARAAAARPGARAPVPLEGSAPAPSDASPELVCDSSRI